MIFRRALLFTSVVFCLSLCVGPILRGQQLQEKLWDRLTLHQAPKKLSPKAVTEEWSKFLGPNDEVKSSETLLKKDWGTDTGQTPLALVWEIQQGEGYSTPVVEKDRMVLFHALNGQETLECIHPETGALYWRYQYPMEYRDRYGFANGPRSTPLIAEGKVVSLGVTAMLTCVDLETGKLVWQRNLRADYGIPQDFFGHGGSPNFYRGKIIVNVGGKGEDSDVQDDSEARYEMLARKGVCLAAFDLPTGKERWRYEDVWGASYASPLIKTVHGRDVCMAYVGGESNPATGGLVVVDAETGEGLARHSWRGDEYIQATGSSPVWIPELQSVFISTAYPKGRPLGGVMLEIDTRFGTKEKWSSKKFATHWMTPVYKDGYLYGIDGETERRSYLVCYDAATGEEKWRDDVKWDDLEISPSRAIPLGIQRASLLQTGEDFLVLGELGGLARMKLTPQGYEILNKQQLFYAPGTWGLPLVHHGLLFITQNEEEQVRAKTGRRVLCYDLRG